MNPSPARDDARQCGEGCAAVDRLVPKLGQAQTLGSREIVRRRLISGDARDRRATKTRQFDEPA